MSPIPSRSGYSRRSLPSVREIPRCDTITPGPRKIPYAISRPSRDISPTPPLGRSLPFDNVPCAIRTIRIAPPATDTKESPVCSCSRASSARTDSFGHRGAPKLGTEEPNQSPKAVFGSNSIVPTLRAQPNNTTPNKKMLRQYIRPTSHIYLAGGAPFPSARWFPRLSNFTVE